MACILQPKSLRGPEFRRPCRPVARLRSAAMGWFKRVFGSTDAMVEARAEMKDDDAQPGVSPQSHRPAGWGEVETSQEGEDLVIAMPVPGLDPDSIHLETEGSSLKLHAKGSGRVGQHILLNETLALPEGSDPSPATVSYTDGRLVVRIPKSALKAKPAS